MVYVRVSLRGEERNRILCHDEEEARRVLATERRHALSSNHIVRGSPEEGWLTMRTDPELEPVARDAPLRLDIIREEASPWHAVAAYLRGVLRRPRRHRSSG